MSGKPEEEELGGWSTSRVLEWVIVGAVSFPLMAGFVALGTAVVAGRSLRDLARVVWSWVPGREPEPLPAVPIRRSDAA
jgi:hypothetical protein